MADDITIPVAALGGGGSVISLVVGWFLRSHNARLSGMEGQIEKLETKIDDGDKTTALATAAVDNKLASYQLDAERRFAKEESVQLTLSRLHDRLDEMGKDIKIIIGKTGAAG